MAKIYRIQETTLDAIGNAIREKTGKVSSISPSNMPAEILSIGGKEDYRWHQCSDLVRSYITNVNYTNVDYSISEIDNYAPTPANYSRDTKPIGQTIENVTFYNAIPYPGTLYATENKAGTLLPQDQIRWINSKTNNMRDLGGWPCDGGTVKYGLLYRSGELNTQDEDLLINQLGINTECDLTADGTPAFPGKMRYIGHTSYAMYSLYNTEAWQVNLEGIFNAIRYKDPVIFHCSMGADRTATLACILEGLLGMSQSDIDKDYELSSFYTLRARNGNYQGGTSDWAHLIARILALDGSTFRDKCVTFVLSLGFTVSEINTYRHAMIDGTPEDIALPAYSVTNTLTGCSTSNAATSVEYGSSYSATITESSGYTLTGATVQITMNGVDITASAYNNGEISIATVTGNIVISIVAIETPSYTNQIPISTDANGNIYNTTGYKEGYRLNSSGAETALSGSVVTGFIPFVLGQEIVFNKFSGSESSNGGVYFYDSAHTFIASNKVNTLISNGLLTAGESLDYTPTSPTYDSGSGNMKSIENVAYIRISAKTSTPAALSCGILGGEPQQTNLFDSNDTDVTLGARINSSGNAVAYADGQLVTGFIPAAAGDVFRIETDKALNTNSYTGMMATYTSAKGWIWNAGYQRATLEDEGLTEIITVLSNNGGHDQTGTAYVRFCIAYTDINNIKIYKQ